MKKYKYIIFDFNGTIIDDVNLCLDILNKMLVCHGHKEVTKEKYRKIFTFPITKYYKLAGFDFEKESFEVLAVEFIDAYQKASLSCNLYDKAVEVFSYLKEKGYILIVLSASEINNLKEQLNHFGINHYFDTILGLDNIHASSKVSIGIEFLKNNNIDPNEVLMIGDTIHDKEVATEMKIDCILVSSGHQHHDVLNVDDNKVIKQLKELLNIL